MSLGTDSVTAQIAHPQLADDLRTIAAALLGSTAEFGQTITIRRGAATLAAQDARIVPQGGASSRNGTQTQQEEQRVLVVGGIALDIAAGDRFNDADGTLYEVYYVRPNRQVQVVAEARAVQ